jgi:type I restriction enzyme S subunit
MTGTGGQRRVPVSFFRDLRIPLPPIEEQRKIAGILDHADSIKDAARQAVIAADGYAQALYHEMFSTFPASFMLGDVCKRITDGTHQSPGWTPSGVPFLFVSNITSGEIDLHTAKFISHETWTELTRRTPIEVGDVLYSTVGTFGVPAVVRTSEPFAFQRHIAHLKPDRSAVNSDFLATQLATSSVLSQAKRLARGAAQPTLNLSDLARIRIAAPPLEVQTEFAERIGAARAVRAKLTTQSRLVEDLGASLNSRAFHGGI